MVSRKSRFVGTVHVTDRTLQFVNSLEAKRLVELVVPSPDYFMRTKIKALHVDWDPHNEDFVTLLEKLESGLVQYRAAYTSYYEECKHLDLPKTIDL